MKVIHRKLGKEQAWGLAHNGDNKIELDVRLKGRRHLLYLIHETMHIMFPEWSETKVVNESRKLTKVIWNQKYRRAEL
jgi:hypothetical protein